MKLMVRYVHKIAPRASDIMGPIYVADNILSSGVRRTIAGALRDAKVLPPGGQIKSFRVEGESLIVFPSASVWHSIVLTRA